MFSTLTLTVGTHIPEAVALSREEAFPAPQSDFYSNKILNRPDWCAAEVPKNGGHLSLQLRERIGGGRGAVVYAAEIARPNRCRTLAREAWIYERLPEDDILDASSERRRSDDTSRDDPLRDDMRGCDDSPPGGRELSSWCDWRPDPEAPLLAVLVMARGGRKYTLDEDDFDPRTEAEVNQILDDLSSAYIMHQDLRPANLIRAPAATQKCPTHKRVHKWNIIDFGWSSVDEHDGNDVEGDVIKKLHRFNYENPYFRLGSDDLC
ncbi:uncharacterized protein B0H18DRAFT_1083677 [Fomitopsis serialis]|uniref:uncharacterized protein n=1 Tax=Fomitopsis serialis TaxID=139415 RepID=UPI0020078F55|nr:uncharacterized protein B0H18DRAFT_1083677 [Neoantrodia serialis]KAH9930945.1 hypothetical protein B0H18DRAFT_1083677 [Neoantrodia serialis]